MNFFHGSRHLFRVGDLLSPQPGGYTSSHDNVIAFERYVDSRRPEHRLPRAEAVFLVSDPCLIDYAGGYTDAIYVVRPCTEAQMSDLYWYSEASAEFESMFYGGRHSTDKLDQCVDRYWGRGTCTQFGRELS